MQNIIPQFLYITVFQANRKLQLEATQHLIKLLPPANRDTLEALLSFLAKVAKHAQDSICPKTGKKRLMWISIHKGAEAFFVSPTVTCHSFLNQTNGRLISITASHFSTKYSIYIDSFLLMRFRRNPQREQDGHV